jgi:hypothetical protein
MSDISEVITTYIGSDGTTFEIDHLGIANPNQWGEFAIYRNNIQIAEFSTDAAGYLPEHRPLLPETDELIALAKVAVYESDQP